MTTNARSNRRSNSKSLLADHRVIEDQYLQLLEAARAGDLATLSALWTEFERRLSAHMDGEEQFILAPLERRHSEIVRAIREEHQVIRTLISTVGVSTDLHEIRLRALEDLGRVLRDHATKEQVTIYQMAALEIDCGPILRFLHSQAAMVD